MAIMTQRYPIIDLESGRFHPWWKNFVASLGNFDMGSSEFVQTRDQALQSVGAKYLVDWFEKPELVMQRCIEFQEDDAALLFILKWS